MEKKTTKKAAAEVAEPVVTEKKTATRKCCAKKTTAVVYNEETAGCRAGVVYETLAAAEGAMTIKEIAKAGKITEQETVLGMGWLLREGKLNVCEDKVALA